MRADDLREMPGQLEHVRALATGVALDLSTRLNRRVLLTSTKDMDALVHLVARLDDELRAYQQMARRVASDC